MDDREKDIRAYAKEYEEDEIDLVYVLALLDAARERERAEIKRREMCNNHAVLMEDRAEAVEKEARELLRMAHRSLLMFKETNEEYIEKQVAQIDAYLKGAPDEQ